MKKKYITLAVAVSLSSAILFSSCIGSFALTNRLLKWNNSVGNKFVNELVFFAFWILPVYEVASLADIVVLNTIEFWDGKNPMTASTKEVQGKDGDMYLVKSDATGYTITNETSGEEMRLNYDPNERKWDVTPSGSEESYDLIKFVDQNTVMMPNGEGAWVSVELSEHGVMAYQAMTSGWHMMAKK